MENKPEDQNKGRASQTQAAKAALQRNVSLLKVRFSELNLFSPLLQKCFNSISLLWFMQFLWVDTLLFKFMLPGQEAWSLTYSNESLDVCLG